MADIEMSRIEKQKIGRTERIINFENYIGTFFRDMIKIFELNDNLDINLKNSFSTGKPIKNIDFNSKYKDILLTIPANDYIKLYNISNQNNFEVISILNGESTKDAHYAKFNPTNENIIISSKDKIIDIWDITKYTNINNIQSEKIIYNLAWDISGNYFGYIKGLKGLNICDNDNKNIIAIVTDNVDGFEFINSQDLITFHNDSVIKRWDIRYYNKPKLEIKGLSVDYELYDKNNDYIYIKNDLFQIYTSDNFNIIHEEEFDFCNDPIILDSRFLKNGEIANMAEIGKNYKFNIIKIAKKNKSTFGEKNEQNNIKEQKDFVNNIVYKISNYENFSEYINQSQNQKKDVYFRNKNYLEIDAIKTELNSIRKFSLSDRKKYVKDVYDGKIKVNPFKDKIDEYIHYIKLLIRDNTNKSLLKDYLQFLEKNETELSQKISLEKYKDEVEFYKVCFNKKEYMENFGLSKEKSEKENLVDFLIQIKDSKDINQFIGLMKNIKSMVEYPYFNQPINEENEELLFFKSKLILYHEISSIDYKKQDNNELFLSQKKIIEEILKSQYLEKYNISKNYDIIFLLINLIVYPESDEKYNKYILNLLNSIIPEKEINDIIAELEKHKDSELLLKVIGIKDNAEKICKRNLKAYLNKDIEAIINKKSDLYIFDENWKEKSKEMDLIKIKNFLKEIFKKETFKKIFSILYKEEDLKIIYQDYLIDDYVDNHLFLVPYKSKNLSGLTDRFSCNSYIFFCEDILSNNNIPVDNIITYALKTSRFIIIALHEFNHYIYSHMNLLFDSPRKKELNINEGDLLMELILFGDETSDINLEQSIYILDEKNYDKTEKQFQKEFINIAKAKKLYINGNYYSSFNINMLSQKDFQYKRNITIKTKMKKLNRETYKRLKKCG